MKHNLFIHTCCLLMIGFLGITSLFAQPPIEWQNTFGGSSTDILTSIEPTNDGGYIIGGVSASSDGDVAGNQGSQDYWIVKLNAWGAIEWQRDLGGSGLDVAFSTKQSLDGGYIIAGATQSNNGDVVGNHGSDDIWIVKLDATGTIEWQKCLGGSGSEKAQAIDITADGGYIVAGYSTSIGGDVTSNQGATDCWVVKLDAVGTIVWQKSLGGSSGEMATDIRQTSDKGYIFVSNSYSLNGDVIGNHGVSDIWAVKLDSVGTLLWQKCLGGSNGETVGSVLQTQDGGYILAGTTLSNDGDVTINKGFHDCWLIKLDSLGNIEWQKSLGGTNSDTGRYIAQCSDKGYIVCGQTLSNDGDVTFNHGNADYWVAKLDATGTLQWEKSYGGTNTDVAIAIHQLANDEYIIGGHALSDDGDITNHHGAEDIWVVKLSLKVATESPTLSNITISPNPTTGKLYIHLENPSSPETVQISITNLLGQTILQQEMIDNSWTLDIGTQPAGVYFLHIKQANGGEMVKKFEKL